MKDPLQRSPTPYEILQIGEEAGLAEINRAFKKMMLAGVTDEMKEARQTLCEPEDRAFLNVFLYSDAYLDQLKPAVKNDPAALVYRRANTLEAWSNMQERLFPHAPSMHSVAVLSYWWALDNEERELNGEATEGMPKAPGDLWTRVIGNWANIISNTDFLRAWAAGREGVNAGRLSSKLEMHFKNLFENLAKRNREAGREERAELFKDRLLRFVTEVDTGRSLIKQRLKVNVGIESVYLCGGKVFLESIGLLDAAVDEVGRALVADPKNEGLKSLALSLSEFGPIALMMQNKDYGAALELLDALSEEQKKEGGAVRLAVGACLEKGRMHFEANDFDEAFALWKRAAKSCGLGARKARPSAPKTKAPPAPEAQIPAPKPERSDEALIARLISDPNERVFINVLFIMSSVGSAEEEFVALMSRSILEKLKKEDQAAIVRRIPSDAVRNRMMKDLGVR